MSRFRPFRTGATPLLSDCRQPAAWRLALTIVGTLVGAGFASGREVSQFFAVFGPISLFGVALTAILLGAITDMLLADALRYQTRNHASLIRVIIPGSQGCTTIFDVALSTFLFGGLTVMIAGVAALFASLGFPRVLGTLLMAILVLAFTYRGSTQLMSLNSYLTPILAAGIFIIALVSIAAPGEVGPGGPSPHRADGQELTEMPLEAPLLPNWLAASLLYLAFNITGLIPVLSLLGDSPEVSGAHRPGAWFGATLFALLISTEVLALLAAGGVFLRAELPMLSLAELAGPAGRIAFSVSIFLAMLTTAVADCHSLTNRYSHGPHTPVTSRHSRTVSPRVSGSRVAVTGAIVSGASLLSFFGFAPLVRTLYPIFGYVGLLFLAVLLMQKLRSLRDK